MKRLLVPKSSAEERNSRLPCVVFHLVLCGARLKAHSAERSLCVCAGRYSGHSRSIRNTRRERLRAAAGRLKDTKGKGSPGGNSPEPRNSLPEQAFRAHNFSSRLPPKCVQETAQTKSRVLPSRTAPRQPARPRMAPRGARASQLWIPGTLRVLLLQLPPAAAAARDTLRLRNCLPES